MTGLRHWLHENYPEIYREYERSLIPKNCPRGKESFVCLDCQYAILATTTDEKNRCEIFPNSPLETFIPSPSCKWDSEETRKEFEDVYQTIRAMDKKIYNTQENLDSRINFYRAKIEDLYVKAGWAYDWGQTLNGRIADLHVKVDGIEDRTDKRIDALVDRVEKLEQYDSR